MFDSERPAVHDFAADMDSEVARDSESEPAQAQRGFRFECQAEKPQRDAAGSAFELCRADRCHTIAHTLGSDESPAAPFPAR